VSGKQWWIGGAGLAVGVALTAAATAGSDASEPVEVRTASEATEIAAPLLDDPGAAGPESTTTTGPVASTTTTVRSTTTATLPASTRLDEQDHKLEEHEQRLDRLEDTTTTTSSTTTTTTPAAPTCHTAVVDEGDHFGVQILQGPPGADIRVKLLARDSTTGVVSAERWIEGLALDGRGQGVVSPLAGRSFRASVFIGGVLACEAMPPGPEAWGLY